MDIITGIVSGVFNGVVAVAKGVGAIIATYPLPCAITFASSVFLFLLYRWCVRCRIRNCKCCKRCLRCIGRDKFDDFELNVLVHSVDVANKKGKVTCFVRVTADKEEAQTSTTSKGVFNEQCTLTVLQGINVIQIELLDHKERLLASMTMDVTKDILAPKELPTEKEYAMKHERGMLTNNPKLKLSMILDGPADDEETGLLSGISSDANIMVRQQIKTAVAGAKVGGANKSDLEVLRDACAGPLDHFQEMGRVVGVYVAILGPPAQKKYAIGVWQTKGDYEERHKPLETIDLMHVKGVQPDPSRGNIFMINYVEKSKVRKDKEEDHKSVFRTIDRSRDAWVEMLHLLLKKLHAEREGRHH